MRKPTSDIEVVVRAFIGGAMTVDWIQAFGEIGFFANGRRGMRLGREAQLPGVLFCLPAFGGLLLQQVNVGEGLRLGLQSQVCGSRHFQVGGVELLCAVGVTAQILCDVLRCERRLGMCERPQRQTWIAQNAPTVLGCYLPLLCNSLGQFRREIRLSLALC